MVCLFFMQVALPVGIEPRVATALIVQLIHTAKLKERRPVLLVLPFLIVARMDRSAWTIVMGVFGIPDAPCITTAMGGRLAARHVSEMES